MIRRRAADSQEQATGRPSYNVRLLQVSERESLPKLKDSSKLIKFKEEINGIIEENLEEVESDMKCIHNLIQTGGRIMTQTMNWPNKRNRN